MPVQIENGAEISGLQFNTAPGVQESASSKSATSTILTVSRSHRRKEVDLEVNEEHLPADGGEGMGGADKVHEKVVDGDLSQLLSSPLFIE